MRAHRLIHCQPLLIQCANVHARALHPLMVAKAEYKDSFLRGKKLKAAAVFRADILMHTHFDGITCEIGYAISGQAPQLVPLVLGRLETR